MEPVEIVVRSPRLVARLRARSTPALEVGGIGERDLGRYYALLDRERPGTLISPAEACLIRDVLPVFRAARRENPEATLAGALEAHVGDGDGRAYEVDVRALADRLRKLGPVGLMAVIDLAERMNAAVLRGDFDGRERARREFGVSG